jgi:hypothetical protein
LARKQTVLTSDFLSFPSPSCILYEDGLCGLVVRVLWLQTRRPGFDSWRYQMFREVMGLERGPLILMSTIEEQLERKSSGFSLEIREYGCEDPLH